MIEKYLWIFGSLILTVLGAVHLFYTFFSNKFYPRDKMLEKDMKMANLILTRETTMWKAWKGFNASHSIGVMFIGLINLYLTFIYFAVLQSDNIYFLSNILTVGFYIWLAKKYWFKIPFAGTIVTFICFIISYFLTIINK